MNNDLIILFVIWFFIAAFWLAVVLTVVLNSQRRLRRKTREEIRQRIEKMNDKARPIKPIKGFKHNKRKWTGFSKHRYQGYYISSKD